MKNREEWDLFMSGLYENACKAIADSEAHRNRRQVIEKTDKALEEGFIDSQRRYVEDLLFDYGAAIEGESTLLYRQGMRDCIWLLKELDILA